MSHLVVVLGGWLDTVRNFVTFLTDKAKYQLSADDSDSDKASVSDNSDADSISSGDLRLKRKKFEKMQKRRLKLLRQKRGRFCFTVAVRSRFFQSFHKSRFYWVEKFSM